MLRGVAVVVAAVALAGACTQDFDTFSVDPGAGGSGGAGAGGADGGGSGGSAGLAGSAGASGTGGTGGDAATDAPTEADGGCQPDEKWCGACVPLDDPAYGCANPGCTPCPGANAVTGCDTTGQCAVTGCLPGYGDCTPEPGCETDLGRSASHCGACGAACSLPNATAACNGGTCEVAACSPGFADCSAAAPGCESNLAAPTTCGSCGRNCTASDPNAICVGGNCQASPCQPGRGECDGIPTTDCETDLTSSNQHCGFCNNACQPVNGTGRCNGGRCEIVSCNPGFDDCDGDPRTGCETNLSTSILHCGGCGRACSATGTVSRLCAGGVCTSSCAVGRGNCTTPSAPAADDGCETQVDTNVDHCGACNRACSSAGTSARQCTLGRCSSTCQTGRGNCDQPLAPNADDGCEADLAVNPQHCGDCGRSCSAVNTSSRVCSGGLCTSTCVNGWGNCSTPAAPGSDDGCERNLQNDPNNCGFCGRACSSNNAVTRACVAGNCAPGCAPGFLDCAAPPHPAPDDGCEVSSATDPDNCGACNRACALTNTVSRVCSGGACTPTCQTGYTDCTRPVAPFPDNGCEASLSSDPDNCGACGKVCSGANVATRRCVGGACAPLCAGGWGDCSTPSSGDDGCETNLLVSLTNCGACGYACSSANTTNVSCNAGSCQHTCAAGFSNCSTPTSGPDDACETATGTDPKNCGACGRACSATGVASLSCSGGQCAPYCDIGRMSCVSPPTDDGCEGNSTANRCGSCSNDCALQEGKACLTQGNLRVCGCTADNQCRYSGATAGTCNTSTGLCTCPVNETCRLGESCVRNGNVHNCACNGGAACAAGQVCCQNPAGCRNLNTDVTSCGACGRACPPGFICATGACQCDGDGDCNAGSPGTCLGSGQCRCGTTTCTAGRRCQPDGTCG